MNERLKFKLGKILLLSAKIGIGASVAIYIAELLNLHYHAVGDVSPVAATLAYLCSECGYLLGNL